MDDIGVGACSNWGCLVWTGVNFIVESALLQVNPDDVHYQFNKKKTWCKGLLYRIHVWTVFSSHFWVLRGLCLFFSKPSHKVCSENAKAIKTK